MSRYSFSIWWIKKDLRLQENKALNAALELSDFVLPVYIFEPSIISSPDYSDFHKHAVTSALTELKESLSKLGSNIWVQKNEFEEVIEEINKIKKVDAIFSHEETGLSFTFRRDKRVKSWLNACSIKWYEFPTNGVIRKLKNREERPLIWSKRINCQPVKTPNVIPLEQKINSMCEKNWEKFNFININKNLQIVSESKAYETLNSFLNIRGANYSSGISSPNSAFSAGSRLSSQIAYGTITIKQIIYALNVKKLELRAQDNCLAKKWKKSLNAFSSRLHWHDHFIQRLESESEMEFLPLNKAYIDLPYNFDQDKLNAWLNGLTGVPMIDACMRCLKTTGFLNFRMRAMVVSYACHVLHLSWKDILYPLAKLFLDYEPGIHVSQIQMQAGVVGINTLRVYNPDKQMVDQDPDLRFIKKWLPELASNKNEDILNYLNTTFKNYPKPMVDYKSESTKMKKAIYKIKGSKEAKTQNQKVFISHGSRKKNNTKRKSKYHQLSLFK